MSTPPRSDLIQNAILFLNDPKVHSSTLTSKIEFLQSKGLNEQEIQEALRLAGPPSAPLHPGSGPSSYGRDRDDVYGYRARGGGPGPSSQGAYGYGHGYDGRNGGRMDSAPIPPKRDWRDLFIMAVVSGGVVYGLSTLARKYLLPHLRPPSSTAFQSTSAEITAQYDEAAELLRDIKEQTGALQKSVEEDRERVNAVVSEVEDAIKAVRLGEETWRGELREIRGEVESVRELVPRMIEKHSSSQSSALADLQSELKSLKTLLISRQHLVSTPTAPAPAANFSTTSQPTSNNIDSSPASGDQAAGSSFSSSAGMLGSRIPSNSQSGSITPTAAAANALLGGSGSKKSIPAWQLAPSFTATSSASTASPSAVSGGTAAEEEEKGKGLSSEDEKDNSSAA